MGPTSSGKTDLGIALAKKFHGEIINADARQVYKGLDIGTGKPVGGERNLHDGHRAYVVKGVPHYLMDFLPPQESYTVAEWSKKAMKAIRHITARGHLPIVVGGTGLYIQALVDAYKIPAVPPQPTYRKAMESKSLEELATLLRQVDPEAVNIVDMKNRRRVLRALEVVTFTGKSFAGQRQKTRPKIDAFLLSPTRSKEELHARIDAAVEKMIERGWIDEIRGLHGKGISWDAPAMTSIGYRELVSYIQGEMTLDQAIALVKRATKQYAKRQMTWFKRNRRIHWVKDEEQASGLVREWLEDKWPQQEG